jgi:hypothetical protein
MKAETVTFSKTIAIADADGVPICVGSVLRKLEDGDRGVVIRITRAGMLPSSPFDAIGDMHVRKSAGVTRCSNQYATWRHIPHNEQTYEERYWSWYYRPETVDTEMLGSVSKDEARACSAIMALLPEGIVDYDYGPFPDRLEDALKYLVDHLSNSDSPTQG